MRKIKEIIVKVTDWLNKTFTGELGYAAAIAAITQISAAFKSITGFAFVIGLLAALVITTIRLGKGIDIDSHVELLCGVISAIAAQAIIWLYMICW